MIQLASEIISSRNRSYLEQAWFQIDVVPLGEFGCCVYEDVATKFQWQSQFRAFAFTIVAHLQIERFVLLWLECNNVDKENVALLHHNILIVWMCCSTAIGDSYLVFCTVAGTIIETAVCYSLFDICLLFDICSDSQYAVVRHSVAIPVTARSGIEFHLTALCVVSQTTSLAIDISAFVDIEFCRLGQIRKFDQYLFAVVSFLLVEVAVGHCIVCIFAISCEEFYFHISVGHIDHHKTIHAHGVEVETCGLTFCHLILTQFCNDGVFFYFTLFNRFVGYGEWEFVRFFLAVPC